VQIKSYIPSPNDKKALDEFFKKIDRLDMRLEKIQAASISGKYQMPE